MYRRRHDIVATLTNLGRINPIELIARGDEGRCYLAFPCVSHDQLRNAQRQRIILLIIPPGMERLAIRADEDLHSRMVDTIRHPGLDQEPGLDFILVAVPQLLLLLRQSRKRWSRDDILDAGEPRWVGVGHVDGALDEVGVHDRAVVVGVDLVVGFAADEVEAVEEEHDVCGSDLAEGHVGAVGAS